MTLLHGKSRWMFLVVVIAGIALSILMNKSRPPMQHTPAEQKAKEAQVVIAKKHKIKPAITGFGEIEPDVLLEAKAEVAGKIEYIHPQLRSGFILPKGTIVARIEQQDYQLALKQAEADLVISRANLKQMQISLDDTEVSLKLAQEKLEIANAELARNEKLRKNGAISASILETKKTTALQLRQEVQNLKSQLETLPSQVDVQAAKVVISEAAVDTQKRNLARTSIELPFDARIIQSNVEENQFVSQGTLMFSAQTIDRVIVNAQFPLSQFQILARSFNPSGLNLPDLISAGKTDHLFSSLGITAKVKLTAPGNQAVWPGTLERISSNLDPSSRTLGVIIRVENPYQNIEPGKRPPLIQGMYVEVTLAGNENDSIVVPRDTLHGNQLYTVDDSKRLRRRTVNADAQGDMILISEGIEEGNAVVTSDLFPAVDGMSLDTTVDATAEARIKRWLEDRQ